MPSALCAVGPESVQEFGWLLIWRCRSDFAGNEPDMNRFKIGQTRFVDPTIFVSGMTHGRLSMPGARRTKAGTAMEKVALIVGATGEPGQSMAWLLSAQARSAAGRTWAIDGGFFVRPLVK
jgi:hypothetical protein